MRQQRISNFTAWFMITVTLIVDGTQFLLNFIPFLGTGLAEILGIILWLTLFIWFTIKGVSFSDSRKSGALLLAGILEVLPILGALPAWTLSTVVIIAISRTEDALVLKAPSSSMGKIQRQILRQKAEQQIGIQKQKTSANDEHYQQEQPITLENRSERIPLQNFSFKNPVAANDDKYNAQKAA